MKSVTCSAERLLEPRRSAAVWRAMIGRELERDGQPRPLYAARSGGVSRPGLDRLVACVRMLRSVHGRQLTA